MKPVNTLTINQVSQYKSTSSLIPPIREAEDECWAPRPAGLPKFLESDWGHLLIFKHKSSRDIRRDDPSCFPFPPLQQACCSMRFRIIHEDNHSPMLQPSRQWFALLIYWWPASWRFILSHWGDGGSLDEEEQCKKKKKITTAKRDNYYDNLIKFSSCKSCLFSCWWTTTSAFILPGVAVILYSMLKCVFYIQLQSHHNGIVSDWRSVISLPFGANSQHLWQLRRPVSMSEMAFGSSLISL